MRSVSGVGNESREASWQGLMNGYITDEVLVNNRKDGKKNKKRRKKNKDGRNMFFVCVGEKK